MADERRSLRIAAKRLLERCFRVSTFYHFIVTYVALIAVLFALFMPIYQCAVTITRQVFLQQRQYALDRSAAMLEGQIQNLSETRYNLSQWQQYMEMCLLEEEDFSLRYYYNLYVLQTALKRQLLYMDIDSYGYIVFTRNRAAISSLHYLKSARELFSIELKSDTYTSDEIARMFTDAQQKWRLIPLGQVTVTSLVPEQSLLLLHKPAYESAAYGMLIQESALVRALLPDPLPEGTRFLIFGPSGDTLFAHGGETSAAATKLASEVPSLSIRFELSIPNAYIEQLTRPLLALNRRYIAVALVLGFALALLFSRINLIPLKKLLHFGAGAPMKNVAGSEYQRIGQMIETSQQENRLLREQVNRGDELLRNNLLTHFLYQDFILDSDQALAHKYLPQFERAYRVACFQLLPGGADSALPELRALLIDRISGLGFCTQLSRSMFISVVEEKEGALSRALRTSEEIIESAKARGVVANIGVSDLFTSMESLREAFLHAQFALTLSAGAPSLYQSAGEEARDDHLTMTELNKLHNRVASCDEEGAVAFIQEWLLRCADKSDTVRFILQFALFSIAREMRVSPFPLSIDAPAADGETLCAAARRLVRALNEKKENPNAAMAGQIAAHIRAHIADPSLSMDSIAQCFGISKSFLYRITREPDGASLSEQITRARVTGADKLLRDTDMSIQDIAAACGYNSSNTLYKAYKRYYGVAPNAVRGADRKDAPAGE